MTTTIRPTRQALRLHRSHLATTHRAPLVGRPSEAPGERITSFTPLRRDPVVAERLRSQTHES